MKLLLTAALGVSVASGTLLMSLFNEERSDNVDASSSNPDQILGSPVLSQPENHHASDMSAQAAGFSVLPAGFRGAWAGKHPADDAATW